jgi:CheY-like chemotaxis protein
MRQRGRPARILLVEDSVADAKLVELALEESGSTTELMRAEDGVDALAKLDAVVAGDIPRPDLVVLDINLPRVNGIDVLRRIKGDPDLRTVPVVVFSTSRADVDVSVAYACGASSYVVKPLDLHRFMDVVRSIESYWTAVVRLP